MPFPSHADYDLAVRYIGRFVFDPVLKAGTPRSRNGVAVGQGGEPLCYPGGFAKVYVVDCASRTYALRVWLHEISDAAKRYHATTQFLKKHPLPFFVEHFEFVAGGILVQGKRYPILRMEWVEGYSLRDFIKLNLSQPALLRAAADSFAAMVAELHTKRVAHGDLQSENLLLRANNGTVRYKLIDYDTLVVPALLGQPTASTGLASYQHPNRAASVIATEKDDYFSELVIYTSLCALSHDPHLWAEFPSIGRDKELLFEAADFAPKLPSPLFQRLYRIGGNVKSLAVVLWNFSRCPNIQLLLPLEAVIEIITQSAISPIATVPPARNKSSFDELLKRKLGEKQVGGNRLPRTWLDDSAFHAHQERAITSKPPPLPRQSAATDSSNVDSTTPKGSFQDILARMQAQPTAPPPPPSKSTSGCVTAAIVIFGIVVALVAISTCENSNSSIPPPQHNENSSPGNEEKRTGPQAPRISAREQETTSGQEKQVESKSPTMEEQRAEKRKLAQEQFQIGWDYGRNGRFSDAALSYRKAVEIDPEFALAWYNMGWSYSKLGNSVDAIVAYEKAVELKPDFQDGWYSLAIAYAGINKVDNASDAIVHLRKLDEERAQTVTRQFNSDFVQKLAIAEYPSLGVANSPLNREFVARYFRYKAAKASCLDYSDWPIVIAQEAAQAIGK